LFDRKSKSPPVKQDSSAKRPAKPQNQANLGSAKVNHRTMFSPPTQNYKINTLGHFDD